MGTPYHRSHEAVHAVVEPAEDDDFFAPIRGAGPQRPHVEVAQVEIESKT
jgi:hypothetical protein